MKVLFDSAMSSDQRFQTSLLLLIITAVCCNAHLTDFSVYIKGTFLCRDEPFKNWPLEVMTDGQRFRYEDDMDRFTKENGQFSIKAWTTVDAHMIRPYIVIQHNCWESKEVPHKCYRKIIQVLEPDQVTRASKTPNENIVVDFGTVDLRFKHKYELPTTC